MKSKIKIGGIELSYIEKNPSAKKIIFFIHGNSGSANAWRKQLNDPLFNNYRLIAFDLPAHGSSTFPPIEQCSLPGLASIIEKAITVLAKENQYMIVAVSLATSILAEMLNFSINPKGLALAGPCIINAEINISSMLLPDTHVNVVFVDEAERNEVVKYAKETSLSNDEEDINFFTDDYEAVQKPFRSLLAKSINENKISDEINLLNQYNVPVLIVFGKDEQIVNHHYLDNVPLPLWNNKIYKIENASHLVNIDQPNAFNKLIYQYIQDCLMDKPR